MNTQPKGCAREVAEDHLTSANAEAIAKAKLLFTVFRDRPEILVCSLDDGLKSESQVYAIAREVGEAATRKELRIINSRLNIEFREDFESRFRVDFNLHGLRSSLETDEAKWLIIFDTVMEILDLELHRKLSTS